MYAVIKTGGKQYKVSQGDVLQVEKLEATEGDTISFDQVLMIADGGDIQVGTPVIEGKTVVANIIKHGRGKKVEIVKFRRRKHHRKQMGHRQDYTEIEITEIGGKAGAVKAPAKKAATQKKVETTAPAAKKKAASKKATTKKATTKKKTVTKKAAGKKKTS